jgi:hypothetical protein
MIVRPALPTPGAMFADVPRDVAGHLFSNVAVLYAREDSIYKNFSQHVYDIHRDARNYNGPFPVVAHPPCRAWGRLRTFAKPRPDEKSLGFHAVHAVRTWGGVLEHPTASSLWAACDLPRPGQGFDSFGGWSIQVPQFWWGHRAMKSTWLYIVGTRPRDIPVIPLVLGHAPCTVGLYSGRDKANCRKEISIQEREATPLAFAEWLLDLASRCVSQTPPLRTLGGYVSN